MTTNTPSSQLVRLSERVYRALLVLYPADFRHEYGQHMAQVFRDVSRDVYRCGGVGELVNWWAAALFDLLQSVIEERRKGSIAVSQAKFIQWSGWLCMLAGVFFVASSLSQLMSNSVGGLYQLSLFALIPGMALLMLGLLGILLRYKATMHLFGKVALLAAIIGAGLASAGLLLSTIAAEEVWTLFMIGWLLLLGGHTVFGGFAVTTHLLPRWNFALLIGSAFPLTVVVLGFARQQTASGLNWGSFFMLLLIGVGWLLTGWALNSQPAPTMQPAAST